MRIIETPLSHGLHSSVIAGAYTSAGSRLRRTLQSPQRLPAKNCLLWSYVVLCRNHLGWIRDPRSLEAPLRQWHHRKNTFFNAKGENCFSPETINSSTTGYDFTVFKGSQDGSIKQATAHREVQRDQVLVKITHSGVCGTDLHYNTTDMALGHEGVGTVEVTGPDVKDLKKGDRVDWGYEHDSCECCDECLTGWETFCPSRQMYGVADLDQASFGSHAVWREAFLFKIPDGLSNEDAAPLMCGGATVYNALHVADVTATNRVGIVGIGGLGHLAIQFAAKMGCEVVVFSGTDSKKDEALKLGASEFYAIKGAKELEIGRGLDNLIVTTSAQPDWNLYLGILNPRATISPLSVDAGDLKVPYMGFLAQGLRIEGGIVAARKLHRDMLRFAAHHNIKPINMTFPMNVQGIEDCLKTLHEGHIRYRGILVNQ